MIIKSSQSIRMVYVVVTRSKRNANNRKKRKRRKRKTYDTHSRIAEGKKTPCRRYDFISMES